MSHLGPQILAIALVFGASLRSSQKAPMQVYAPAPQQNGVAVGLTEQQQKAIRLTITTGGGLFGPAKDRFRVGEQIPVTIMMTNTSNLPLYVCFSSPLYQNVPTVSKNGHSLPYMKWKSDELSQAKADKTCLNLSLLEPVLLRPNEPTLVDWFILVDEAPLDAEGWYDQLPPGNYELSIQRLLECCGGPMVESNKINFEVVP